MPLKKRNSLAAVQDQFSAALVDAVNEGRLADEAVRQAKQQDAFENAMSIVATVREFIDRPGNILGNESTKHGEIAEVVEVGIRNAREVVEGRPEVASLDGLPRTGPVDFRVNGFDVQSKFVNGTNNGLGHVLEHLGRNEGFTNDGAYYSIPKDQHAQILRLLSGDTGDFRPATIRAIQEKVHDIERLTGKSFEQAVRPSISEYSDVQQGRIDATLDGHESDIGERHAHQVEDIADAHQASLSEGLKATLGAAAVGAAVGFAAEAFKKYKEGKNVFKGEFTLEDWKAVGTGSAEGAIGGAVTGAAVYALTNCADLAAPLAGAVVSTAKGLVPLVNAYRKGEIDQAKFIDASLFVCSDVALVGLCSAAGQALIPVPVLGAVVGSIAGKVLSSLLTKQLDATGRAIELRIRDFTAALDRKQRQIVEGLLTAYERLGALSDRAFDLESNLRLFEASIELGRAHGVPEQLLLKSVKDVDDYMTL